MTEFHRGDVVSLSRAQFLSVTVAVVPSAPGESYAITLPINGSPVTFEVLADLAAARVEVAAALLAVLLDEQTVYEAALDDAPETIIVSGPLGVPFSATATANLVVAAIVEASLKVDARTGLPIDLIRLTEVEDGLECLRHFWTKGADGVPLERHQLRGREIGSSNVLDFDADEVLTVLHEEGA